MKIRWIWMIALMLLFTNGYGQTQADDRAALIELYNATNGPNWTNTWDLNASIYEWYGVRFELIGLEYRVVCLDLEGGSVCPVDYAIGTSSPGPGNNLSGILPDLNLTELKRLHLINNNLVGELPNFTYAIKLEEIDLGGSNNFVGCIPPGIGDLNNLTDLSIGGDFTCYDPNLMNLCGQTDINTDISLYGSFSDFCNIPNMPYSCQPYISAYVINPSCHNNDGEINIWDDFEGFTIDWDNAPDIISPYSLGAGTYTITITNDYCNYTATESFTLTTNSPYIGDVSVLNPVCGNDGSIIVNAMGGFLIGYEAHHEYSIDGVNYHVYDTIDIGGTYYYSELSTFKTFSNLSEGTYVLYIKDDADCIATDTVTLTNPNPLSTTLIPIDPECGLDNGSIEAQVFGGAEPYIYLWNTTPTQAESTAINLSADTYSVRVIDDNGCETTASAQLYAPEPPIVNLGQDIEVCAPSNILLDAGYSNTVWSTGETGKTIYVDAYGTYSATVTDAACVVTDEIVLEDVIQFNAYPTRDSSIAGGEYIDFELSGADAFSWVPTTGLDCSTCANVRASPEMTTTYTITASTYEGCAKDFTIRVQVGIVPTTLSPDGDGINDTLSFPGIDEFPLNRLTVYNRWGTPVYQADPYTSANEWDGTYRGKRLPTGNYYYVLEVDVANNIVEKGRLFITY